MKKKFFVTAVTLMIVIMSSFSVFAVGKIDGDSNLYIKTAICPQEYVEFANTNISGFVESYYENNISDSNLIVGTPFSFADVASDVFYFPVICNGKIICLFRVFRNDNKLNGAISDFLAKELDSLAYLTSTQYPMLLKRIKNEIVAQIDTETYTLFSYPDEAILTEYGTNYDIATNTAFAVVNAKTDSKLNIHLPVSGQALTNTWSHYIALSITETQDKQNNWCAAFCTAAILRTLGYSSTAEGVMTVFYRRPTAANSITRSQVVECANLRGLHPINVEATISTQNLIDEITADRPVYLSMQGSEISHAVVLRGYNARRSTWSIWNPWFDTYETFSMGGVYLPTGSPSSSTLTYARTIYNWA